MRSVDLSTYAEASCFFDAVRDASAEREKMRSYIERMEAREGVRAQSYEPMPRAGSVSDRTAATDSRMDWESAHGRILEEDDEIVGLALDAIWGGEDAGGVASLMGFSVAKVMELYYVQALPWAEVARRMGYSADSTKSVKALCRQGLRCVDLYGWGNVLGWGGPKNWPVEAGPDRVRPGGGVV